MKKWIVVMVAFVGFAAMAENQTSGDHNPQNQSNPVYSSYQGRKVKQDPNARLFELVSACLNEREKDNKSSVLSQ